MSAIARSIARRIWWAMLRLLRTRLVSRWRRATFRKVSPSMRQRMIRQDRFARKVGIKVITLALNILFLSIAFTTLYIVTLRLMDTGYLSSPDRGLNRRNVRMKQGG